MIKKAGIISILIFILIPGIVAAKDTDNDGLSDAKEEYFYTNKAEKDTDGDGHSDKMEIKNGYSPHKENMQMHQHDYDSDGLNDWVENWFKTDLGAKDTDNDGFSDFAELMSGYPPTNKKKDKTFTREILVDKNSQYLYVVVGGIKIKGYPVSTGLPSMPTPSGTFKIQRKLDTALYSGPDYHYPNVKWNMEFKPRYFIHGTYWHNDFGKKPHSHGCVNMRTPDAKQLYKYFKKETKVRIKGEAEMS